MSGRTAWAVAALRVAAGLVLVAFSIGKFARHGAEAASFEDYGIPFPDLATYLAGAVELVGGLMLVIGLGTRLAAVALAANLAVAVGTAGRMEGGAVNLGVAPALLAVMLVLVWTGAGRPSADDRLTLAGALAGPA